MLASVPLITKFAAEVTARVCELRNRDTRSPLRRLGKDRLRLRRCCLLLLRRSGARRRGLLRSRFRLRLWIRLFLNHPRRRLGRLLAIALHQFGRHALRYARNAAGEHVLALPGKWFLGVEPLGWIKG